MTLKKAITALTSTYTDGTLKAKVIEPSSYETFTWHDWKNVERSVTDEIVRGVNFVMKIPEIIIYTRSDKLPKVEGDFLTAYAFQA